CSFEGFSGTPLIIGSGVSNLFHAVYPEGATRLILLAWQGGNVVIESANVTSQYPAHKWRALTQPILDSFDFR
ncbi:MAG TPA: hypothetical protein VFR45_04595, partial [Nocardioides sp.]|nr:hypothetical protein [Nocardioides sp.]